MDLDKIPSNNDLYVEDGFWKFRWRGDEEVTDNCKSVTLSDEKQERDLIWIGTAVGPKRLTRREALAVIRTALPWRGRPGETGPAAMTVAEFVERRFVPEYVAAKGHFGRIYYQSLLKHIVDPELVDRAFGSQCAIKKARLHFVSGWPYLGDVPLRGVRPDAVKNLLVAALKVGYSMQTVSHIRNVVSTIFGFAEKELCFSGENPARLIRVQKTDRSSSRPPTFADLTRLMNVMQYPEREMTLIAILTGMTFSEICGLRWMHVNLTDEQVFNAVGETIPPRTILVREERVRGQIVPVPEKRRSLRQIANPLIPVLQRLNSSRETTEPDGFVLVSVAGMPFNPVNIVSGRLKPLGRQLALPSLSSQRVCRIHKALVGEFGSSFPDQIASLLSAAATPACAKA